MDKSRIKVPMADGTKKEQQGYIYNRYLFIGKYGKYWRLYHIKSGLVIIKEFSTIKGAEKAAGVFMQLLGDEDMDLLYPGKMTPELEAIGKEFTERINELKIRV